MIRWKQRLLWSLAGGLAAMVLLALLAVIALNATTPSAEAILREHGLPVTPEEWDAWHFEQPDAPNAASLYLEAAALRETDPDAAYALLLEAADYEYCRFSLEDFGWPSYEDSFRPDARELWRLVQARGEDALARGDETALLEALEALLALALAIIQQPSFLDYLTGAGMISTVTYGLLPPALAAGKLDGDALERIDARLARLEQPRHPHRALLGSMAAWISDADPAVELGDAPVIFVRLLEWSSLPARIQAVYAQDFLRIDSILQQSYEEQLEAVRRWTYSTDPVIEFAERVSRSPYQLAAGSPPDHFVTGTAITRGRIAAARGGLLVERFRLAHGRLPESAEELAAAGFSLPDDPLGIAPIRYAVDNGGYRAWSVGLDMLDGGGVENRGGRPDLVFQVGDSNP